MGAWGYRPYDNDEAQDWLDEIQRLIVKKIEDSLRQKSPHTLVAAAGLLVDLDRPPLDLAYDARLRGLFNKLHDVLERLLTEPIPQHKIRINGRYLKRPKIAVVTWAETWSEPELAKQMLDILMRRLRMRELEEAAHRSRACRIFRRRKPKGKKGPAGKKP